MSEHRVDVAVNRQAYSRQVEARRLGREGGQP